MPFDLPLNEPTLRLTAFVSVLAIVALAEFLRPRRRKQFPRWTRWPTNLGMVALATLAVRLLSFLGGHVALPMVAVAAALLAEQSGWGLLHGLAWPLWLEAILGFIALDFAIWLAHVASHKVPLLWRVHRVHHADRDFDVTTALRFHPIEIVLSMLYKVVWVLALGPSVATVIGFEVVLNALAMVNHANLALPLPADRLLRLLIVTPDMHRVHHSVRSSEHNHNFGFNLAVWDRVFGVYTDQPVDGHEGMTIGLMEFQTEAPVRLGWSLRLPFWGR